MKDIIWASASALSRALEAGETTSVEITQALLERTDEIDGTLNAYLMQTGEIALDQAAASDDRRAGGDAVSPFDGVPIGYKDIFCTRGTRTTMGSKILDNFVPPYSATVVERCEAAGMPMLGKLNMDEFAMGSSTENSAYGPTLNPWDTTTVPGGSSGGSTAIVAAGGAPWAWGTDTGGSVRQPASLCGLVGVKPTYGLVSRYGIIAFASSLDQAGPITRTVADAAALLGVAAGHDTMDATSIPSPVPDFSLGIDEGIEGMRIGIVKEFETEGSQPGVQQRVTEAYERLEKLGAKLQEVSLPSFLYGISAYYLLAPAEASSNLARYDGVRYGLRVDDGGDIVKMMSATRHEGFGAEVKRRIMLGTYALSAGYYDALYGQAQKTRTLIIQDLAKAYEEVDLIASPTSPTTAFKLGERTADPLAMYLSDVFTVPVNLAGNAAISLPCGLSPDDNMPVGLQLIAKSLDETTMFRAAQAFETDLGFASDPEMRPAL
ncbi:MAG: Asp-tRNA(Asn)/Glu-tRNA(Gln) amidotransferase subunit GatA [Actinobacteria bacterium]|nr:Asp-tRNA(Asn)/Glu-tRNA(Gln) amidotransferase subunit GatA [Actinomycetota bacterium]